MQEMQEMQFRSLGQEDPLEKETAIHSPYSCLKNSIDKRILAGYNPWGDKEADTSERLSTHTAWLVTLSIIHVWCLAESLYEVHTSKYFCKIFQIQ